MPKNSKGELAALKLTRDERDAIDHARRLGLYVLLEGDRTARVWAIYSRSTGKQVGCWSRVTGKFELHGSTGSSRDQRFVLRQAARRLRSGSA
jgi:hypothetical protein